jgi:prepilin-type N-terminal cleavage/methylation domain-containing protein
MASQRRSRRAGFSFVELLIVMAIISLFLAIAIPMLKTAQMNASETVVIREVQTIHQAQVQYLSQFGEYASSLAQLGPPTNGVSGPHAAKLIPASLASGEKNGYLFTMMKTPSGFAVNAVPKAFGGNGRRTFYIDEDGVVHQNWSAEPATVNSPEFK